MSEWVRVKGSEVFVVRCMHCFEQSYIFVTKKEEKKNETTSIVQKMKTIDYTTASGNEEGMSVLFFFIVEHLSIPFFFVILIG